ncbi:MAG: DUF3592 domain-containing protein, partial [Gemmataceae bacterium]
MDPNTPGHRRPLATNVLLLRGLAVVVVLVTPPAVYYAAQHYLEGSDMASWPQTEGRVYDHSFFEKEEQGRKICAVYIKFTYQVAGSRFLGDRANPGSNEMSAADRDALAARYPINSKHPVYYAPSDPAWAYLEPGSDPMLLARLVLACLLPVVGLVLWAFSMNPPAADSPGARWASLGTTLIGLCFACLAIGGAVVKIFFSEAPKN